jgi:DNA polymerase
VWYALEAAAAKCVHTGLPQEAYGVVYEKIDLWLTALLPSGRRLWYFNPQPVWTSPPWDASDLRMGFTYQAKKQNRWLTISAYGALLCENVVQALARDLMVESAYRAEANGFPIVLTVHDELVTEPDTWCSDYKALEQMMSERSPWATAMKIPVAAEGWQGDRYRK